MSRAKIERRKRRRRLAAEKARRENADIDITDVSDDAEDERAAGPRWWPRRETADRPPRTDRNTDDTAAGDTEGPQPPPLPLAIGALLSVAFAANLVLGGIGQFSKRPVFGGVIFAIGLSFAVVAYYVYKRRRWAWIAMVMALGFVTATFVVGAIAQGAPGWLLGSVFTVAPLLLLLLPGTRETIREAELERSSS